MKKMIVLFCLICTGAIYAQKPIFTVAKVKAATVYFSAAELTQTTSVQLPAGTSEIVVKNVADNLIENTIQVGAPASVTVMSVQFTRNYISEYEIDESNPVIKKVRDSIQIVRKELAKIANEKVSQSKTIDLLDKNQSVSGANSGLNVAELMKLVEYYKAKRTEISNAFNLLTEQESKWNQRLAALNAKLELNTQNEEKVSSGKLVLQVMNETAGLVTFDFNYITNTATWAPFYDLRVENINSPMTMMYKAQVSQNTGIDWKKVKLVLSSGVPNQNNQAPLLHSWFLRYGVPNVYANSNFDDKENTMLSEVVVRGYTAGLKKSESSISQYTSIVENQLNTSFDIDIPYDILSNGKNHSVALKDFKVPAIYKYYAVPKLDKEAFLLAEISDYSNYNLLRGDANIIFEGMYVGKTTIDPNQATDTLHLSMGRDKKIAIKREKVVDKSGTKFLSSYKEQVFTYDITVKNNKKENVELLLKDQFPLSTDKDITVELLESSRAKVNQETAILSWELKLIPGELKKLRISYKIRYPKEKIISNL
jgi:uncharacterized protein (TIGR02231 family)